MYITINKNNIVSISEQKPRAYGSNILAEVQSLPEKYDYLKAENIHEVTDTWQETVESYDENGEVISLIEEKSRTYLTCDLIAKFRPAQSEKQIARRNAFKEIKELKQKLADTDYQAIKYAEGQLSDGEYAMMKVQRQTWRERINELENLIK